MVGPKQRKKTIEDIKTSGHQIQDITDENLARDAA